MDRVKRLSFDVLEKYRTEFGEDFADNKKALDDISIIRSKGLKNEIAGYITKVVKNEMRETREREAQERARIQEEEEAAARAMAAKKAAEEEEAAARAVASEEGDAAATLAPTDPVDGGEKSEDSDIIAIEAEQGASDALTGDESPAVEAPVEEDRPAGAADTAADTAPADTTPADTTPADTTPADTTPADTTPADTAADTTPADTAADTTPADTAADTTPAASSNP